MDELLAGKLNEFIVAIERAGDRVRAVDDVAHAGRVATPPAPVHGRFRAADLAAAVHGGVEPAADTVRRREGRLDHPVGGARRDAGGIIEAGRIVRDRRQELALVVSADATAQEQAGGAHIVPAQGGAGAGGEAHPAFHQVLTGEAIHAEQGGFVQFQRLAVFVGDARVQISLGRGGQLRHWLKNQVGRRAEAAVERIADVHAGAGSAARQDVGGLTQHGRQVVDGIDVQTRVHERLPPQAHRGDNGAAPVDLAGDAAAVHARETVGRAGRDQFRAQGGEADIGVAGQGDRRTAHAQTSAEDGTFRLPPGVDDGRHQRQSVLALENLEAVRVAEVRRRIARVKAQALDREGGHGQVGPFGLAFSIDLADQATTVAVIEPVVLIGRTDVVAVEQGLVRHPFGGETEAPGALDVELAVGQQIAAAGAVAEANIAFGVAVAVKVEVAEVATIGVAAARDDGPGLEPSTPLQVQQGGDLGVDLRTDQPVLGRRHHHQIGNLDRAAPAFVPVHAGDQEAGGAIDAGVGVGEGRQVEDRHAADAEKHVAIQDGAQILILHRLFGLDGDAGLLGPVHVADRTGGEDDPVQFADVFRPTHSGGGHQAGAIGQAQGQIDGDPGGEVGIQLYAAGVKDGAVGGYHFGLTGGGRNAAFKVIGDFLGADAVIAGPGEDAIIRRAAGGHDIAFAAGGVGVHIETSGRQAVGARRRRGHGRLRRLGGRLLGQARQGGHARHQRRAGQEPDAQGSLTGNAAITHAESTQLPGDRKPSD
ncbi:hypothetical protein D3C86_877090 [compost metagenome]